MVLELVEKLDGKDHKIEGLSFGGGPASIKLPETVDKLLPGIPAGQGYGLTGSFLLSLSAIHLLRTLGVPRPSAKTDLGFRLAPTSADPLSRSQKPTPWPHPSPEPTTLHDLHPAASLLPSPKSRSSTRTRGRPSLRAASARSASRVLKLRSGTGRTRKPARSRSPRTGGSSREFSAWISGAASQLTPVTSCSGDVGFVDKEGFLYISDRAKDVVRLPSSSPSGADAELTSNSQSTDHPRRREHRFWSD